jgi:L-Ala-D/L-Glu epimerase
VSAAHHPLVVSARHETWPLKEAFKISRGAKIAAEVIVVTVSDGTVTGRGEAVPYARYGESVTATLDIIAHLPAITTRSDAASAMKPGAALNAVDCAIWDYEAKRDRVSAASTAGQPDLRSVVTAFTLSLDTPAAMAAKAASVAHLPLLKLKLGGEGDAERMAAVRAARPDARLIADANEAWTPDMLQPLTTAAARLGFEVIEQPLPEGEDEALRGTDWPLPICADESVHTAKDIARLAGLYGAVNIKLDKAGGLTGALALHRAARAAGMKIMVGSMVGSSLAVAPAMILAQDAEWTDLDGPLLLASDRDHAIQIDNGVMSPPTAALWG